MLTSSLAKRFPLLQQSVISHDYSSSNGLRAASQRPGVVHVGLLAAGLLLFDNSAPGLPLDWDNTVKAAITFIQDELAEVDFARTPYAQAQQPVPNEQDDSFEMALRSSRPLVRNLREAVDYELSRFASSNIRDGSSVPLRSLPKNTAAILSNDGRRCKKSFLSSTLLLTASTQLQSVLTASSEPLSRPPRPLLRPVRLWAFLPFASTSSDTFFVLT